MKKTLIIMIFFIITMLCLNSFVNASGVNMSLNNTSTNFTSSQTSYDAEISVGSSAGISQSSLSLSNILNILLIVIGILLVLFAIAILIRLH